MIDCLGQGNSSSRPDDQICQDHASNHSNYDINLQDEPGFEIISCVSVVKYYLALLPKSDDNDLFIRVGGTWSSSGSITRSTINSRTMAEFLRFRRPISRCRSV